MEKQEEIKKNSPEVQESPRGSGFVTFLVSFFDFVKTIVLIVALAFAIRVFIIQPIIVDGESMEPTFQSKDYLITEKVSYHFRAPERGEVIIFTPPDRSSDNYIKRIIGLPGEQISIKNGSIYINNERLVESYLTDEEKTLVAQKEGYSTTLGNDEYFVMGDNRSHSRDSREIGSIPKQNIVSRVWFRLLPINHLTAFAAVNYDTISEN